MSDTSPTFLRPILWIAGRLGVFGWLSRKFFGQRIAAVMGLTWKAAFRFRLFLVLATLLIASVIVLPILIKDDGTARGFTQILMTYTLSVITGLLGISTLWLACGTLARDVEECQIQLVAVKPIPRWQIWLGKYLGILSLNAALLVISGASVYTLVQWRAAKLPAEQQQILRNEVLVARGSLREAAPEEEIRQMAEAHFNELIRTGNIAQEDVPLVRRQSVEWAKAQIVNVLPNWQRRWIIDLGLFKDRLRNEPLYVRTKFNAAEKSPSGTYDTVWQVGSPDSPLVWQEQMSLAAETFHEFEVATNLFDAQGKLYIQVANVNPTTLVFPLEDGLEVLYRESSFGVNFARGLTIIFCWMALLAAVGLAMASFMSFPVAAFASLALLGVALSSGTMAGVVSEGTILGSNHETGEVSRTPFDLVMVELFRLLLAVVNWATDFSPIDALSTGRSIAWSTLALALVQILLVTCGIVAAFGMWVFDRRELATAQGTN